MCIRSRLFPSACPLNLPAQTFCIYLVACLLLFTQRATAEVITEARYLHPVDHYGHFALGRPHEYSTLRVTTDRGRSIDLQLPEDEVFEDLKPRLVRLSEKHEPQLLTIVSNHDTGARLALIAIQKDRLVMGAESAPIGVPMRWLNPVGASDLDGDGVAEIAAVITPHIGGNLKIYKITATRLQEAAVMSGFSNHEYGSAELRLSTHITMGGKNYLVVPDQQRRKLRIISFSDGKLDEIGSCALSNPVSSRVEVLYQPTAQIIIPSEPGPINPENCT